MPKRRGRLFKLGVEGIVARIPDRINASAPIWASSTIAGFQNYWVDWMRTVAPELAATVRGLPPKTGNIRQNVIRRVIPVAETISRSSRTYRERLIARITATVAPAGGGGGAPG